MAERVKTIDERVDAEALCARLAREHFWRSYRIRPWRNTRLVARGDIVRRVIRQLQSQRS